MGDEGKVHRYSYAKFEDAIHGSIFNISNVLETARPSKIEQHRTKIFHSGCSQVLGEMQIGCSMQ